jgi:hypothetical protein
MILQTELNEKLEEIFVTRLTDKWSVIVNIFIKLYVNDEYPIENEKRL